MFFFQNKKQLKKKRGFAWPHTQDTTADAAAV